MGPVAITPTIVSQVSARAKAVAHTRAFVSRRCGHVLETCVLTAVAMDRRFGARAVAREGVINGQAAARIVAILGRESTLLWERSVPLQKNVPVGFVRGRVAVHSRECAWTRAASVPWTFAIIAAATAKPSSLLAVAPASFTQSAALASRGSRKELRKPPNTQAPIRPKTCRIPAGLNR